MMFQLDTAFATELIALALGTGLSVLLSKWEVKNLFAKVVSIFVIVTSILGMLCSVYWAATYRSRGYFAHPYHVTMEHEKTHHECGGH